jgi:hypothetical protein
MANITMATSRMIFFMAKGSISGATVSISSVDINQVTKSKAAGLDVHATSARSKTIDGMGSVPALIQMGESMKENGSTENIKALEYYQTLQERNLLGYSKMVSNGEEDHFYLKIVELMAFGMGISPKERLKLFIRMVIPILGI